VDSEDPGFAVTPLECEIGANITDEELQLIEDFLPELIQEMLRQSESDAEG
jgi:hypothetical protein